MLGATQLAWLERTLLVAEQGGTTWKFINISDPIDQMGQIGGNLTLTNAPTAAEYGMLGNITSITTTAASSGSGNQTVTVVSTVGLVVGQPVSGTNVAAGTKIASINTDGTTFTISNIPAPAAILYVLHAFSAFMNRSGVSIIGTCPTPSRTSSVQSGLRRTSSRAAATGMSSSRLPWITRVGARSFATWTQNRGSAMRRPIDRLACRKARPFWRPRLSRSRVSLT